MTMYEILGCLGAWTAVAVIIVWMFGVGYLTYKGVTWLWRRVQRP